jgi:glycosyltransferase involved in cell wall biosynthesis
MLYIGRLEAGKNLRLLYGYVQRHAAEGGSLRLVVAGKGSLTPPAGFPFDFRGAVSEAEKAALIHGALLLCQPSLNESFSLTMMESWLAGRPVLVHEQCDVTREHVRRSKGGLWFFSYDDFAGAIEWIRSRPEVAARMGGNGRRYVEANYTWPAVVDRFVRIRDRWRAGESQP